MSKAVQEMFGRISPRYDLANDVISLGIHRRWRSAVRRLAALRSGERAVDICTGTGQLAFELAKTEGVQVLGVDFVQPMLKVALTKLPAASPGRSLSQVNFVQGDALHLPVPDLSCEVATISFGIRNVDDPVAGLREIFRVLKPGGRILVLEFGQPTIPVFSSLYRFYSASVIPFLGGILTGDREAYRYLPETSARFPSRESFIDLMRRAGFSDCLYTPLSLGIAYLYQGKR